MHILNFDQVSRHMVRQVSSHGGTLVIIGGQCISWVSISFLSHSSCPQESTLFFSNCLCFYINICLHVCELKPIRPLSLISLLKLKQDQMEKWFLYMLMAITFGEYSMTLETYSNWRTTAHPLLCLKKDYTLWIWKCTTIYLLDISVSNFCF